MAVSTWPVDPDLSQLFANRGGHVASAVFFVLSRTSKYRLANRGDTMTKFWHAAAAVAVCVWLTGCGAGAPTATSDASQTTMDPWERAGANLAKTGATTKLPAALASPAAVQAPPSAAKAQ